MLRRLFTGRPQVKSRHVDDTTALLDDLKALRNRVHRLEIAQEELQGHMELLAGQVRSLRGRLTGGIRRAQDDEIPAGKEALRVRARQLGLLPGGLKEQA